MFFEPKRIYNGPFDGHHEKPAVPWSKHPASEVPEGHYTVPLGKAAIVREGEAVTVLCYGTMVHVARAAVLESGIDAESIDLRTLVPLDIDTSSLR
jgi:2-oxoisovalerate dehydrogenase E1 component beta subunit